MPHDSVGIVVFWCQKSGWNSSGDTHSGVPNTRGVCKKFNYILKMVQDSHVLSIKKVNRKSYVLYQMVTLPMTLSDPNHPKSPICLSVGSCVCLSVTSQCSTKMAKLTIAQTVPYDSPGTLVFWCWRYRQNSNDVTPNGGAKCRWDRLKLTTFDK